MSVITTGKQKSFSMRAILAVPRSATCLGLMLLFSVPMSYFFLFRNIGTMPWDYSLVYLSEANLGFSGIFYDGDSLRIYTNLFYHLAYHLSDLLGAKGGWSGYQLTYSILWSLRALLMYLISRRLGLARYLCLLAALITLVHASDSSVGHLGQINQLGLTVWSELAFYCFLSFSVLPPNATVRVVYLAGSIIAGYLALWSHEACLFGILMTPVIGTFLAKRLDFKQITAAACFLAVPILYAFLLAQRLLFHPTGASWQESVLRKDFLNLPTVWSNLVFMMKGLFFFPIWVTDKIYGFRMAQQGSQTEWVLIAMCIVVGIGLTSCFIVVMESVRNDRSEEEIVAEKGSRLLALTLMCIGMCVILLIPFVAMPRELAGYWRTQILSSPWASLAIAISIFACFRRWGGSRRSAVLQSMLLFLIVSSGIIGTTLSYYRFAAEWDKIRAPIQRMIEAAPRVRDGTIIMLQGVPVTYANFKSNFWFDILVRLAYPGTKVAGSYTYRVQEGQREEYEANVKGILAAGGSLVGSGEKGVVIAPHGDTYSVDGDKVIILRKSMPILIEKASLRHAIVLEWSDTAPFSIITSPTSIDLITGPSSSAYEPSHNIPLGAPNEIAMNRFFHSFHRNAPK